MRLWALIIALALAGLPEESVKYLNGIYRETVSGSQKDLFALEMTLLSEEMLAKGYVHQMVLLLNNTLENRLDLHYIRCWEDFNRTKLQLLQHFIPPSKPAEPSEEDILLNELQTFLGVNRLDIQSVSDSSRQELSTTPLSGGPNLAYVMLEKVVKVKRQELRGYLVSDQFSTKYMFKRELGLPEPQSPRVAQASGSTLLVAFLSASVACIASVILTYIASAAYFKRYQTLPCLKGEERGLVYDLK
jgi:hypothetical protein